MHWISSGVVEKHLPRMVVFPTRTTKENLQNPFGSHQETPSGLRDISAGSCRNIDLNHKGHIFRGCHDVIMDRVCDVSCGGGW